MQNPYLRFCIGMILLVAGVVCGDHLATTDPSVHFGKDGGMIFMILMTCLGSILFWPIALGKVVHLITGAVVGLASYVLVLLFYYGLSMIGMDRLDIPLWVDHMLAASVSAIACWFAVRHRAKQRITA
jgi:hypothetical protein